MNRLESSDDLDEEPLAAGVGVGSAAGAALGVLHDDLVLGPAIGMGAGIAVGAVLAVR